MPGDTGGAGASPGKGSLRPLASLKRYVLGVWNGSPLELLAQVALAVAILIYLLRLPYLTQEGLGPFFKGIVYHGWPFLLFLGLTALTRTVSIRMLVAYWFVGAFPVLVLSIFFTTPLRSIFSDDTVGAIFVPIIEEVLKALPILFYFWWTTRKGRWERSVSDGLLLGFVVGAGFAFHENILWGRSPTGFLGDGPLLLTLPFPFLGAFDPVGKGLQLSVSHPGWTAIAGVGIALTWTFRHRILAWAVAPFAVYLVAFDHATWNSMVSVVNTGSTAHLGIDLLAAIRFTLLRDGTVMVLLFLWVVVVPPLVDVVILRGRSLRTRREFPSGYVLIRHKTLDGDEPVLRTVAGIVLGAVRNLGWRTPFHLHAIGAYTRWRRAGLLATRRWDKRGEIPEAATVASIRLLRLRNRAIHSINAVWSSVGDPLDTIPYHYYTHEVLDADESDGSDESSPDPDAGIPDGPRDGDRGSDGSGDDVDAHKE